jgi:hypothetical protein
MGIRNGLKYLLVFALGAYVANFVAEKDHHRQPTEQCEVGNYKYT